MNKEVKRYVQIVSDVENKAVETIDVTGRTNRSIEKLVKGIEINLDHIHYAVYITTDTTKYEESK